MASVAILMATYNGERFLTEQLGSLAHQDYTNWSLTVSDDGSTDGTRSMVEAFAAEHVSHRIGIIDGPRRGYAQNFLHLLRSVRDADFFAFCDQDDVWGADKLEAAVKWLSTIPIDTPALYGCRSFYFDDNGTVDCSTLFKKKPDFTNALVQCIMGGNTMVMNKAARDLIAETPESLAIVAHDWWAYLLVSGAGGIVHYDSEARIGYRQHSNNLLGQNVSAKARLARIQGLFSGVFRQWNDTNVDALEKMRLKLTLENRTTLYSFAVARKQPLARRLCGLYSSGIHRQTLLGNLGLIAAALTNRI